MQAQKLNCTEFDWVVHANHSNNITPRIEETVLPIPVVQRCEQPLTAADVKHDALEKCFHTVQLRYNDGHVALDLNLRLIFMSTKNYELVNPQR